jgi:Flp pilus assembly protein TadD
MVMYVDPEPRYQQEASRASQRALQLEPDLAEAHASRGLACLVCEDYDNAEREFIKAIELNPNLFEAYYYYARTKFHHGDMAAAADLFQKAADVDPADYQSRCLRGQILRGSGRVDEARVQALDAVSVIEQHLKWSPDDARAYHLGAGSLIILNEFERAKRWLHRAIEIAPEDSVVLYNVACNLATLGETEKALDYLERAAEHGAVSAAWMRNDEDLVKLRGDPKYIALLDRLDGSCP